MNIFIALFFAWLTYQNVLDAIEPNRQSRTAVRINSIIIAMLCAFISWGWFVGPGLVE